MVHLLICIVDNGLLDHLLAQWFLWQPMIWHLASLAALLPRRLGDAGATVGSPTFCSCTLHAVPVDSGMVFPATGLLFLFCALFVADGILRVHLFRQTWAQALDTKEEFTSKTFIHTAATQFSNASDLDFEWLANLTKLYKWHSSRRTTEYKMCRNFMREPKRGVVFPWKFHMDMCAHV